MNTFLIYGSGAGVLVGIGLRAVLAHRNLVRQILALNVMGGGVFLLLVALAIRDADPGPDPVPQAMVLTGIVVAVSVSALALAIARSVHTRTGRTTLSDEDLE